MKIQMGGNGPLPIKEWYSELSMVMANSSISPCEMYGISADGNLKYIGNEDGELGSGKGATGDPAVCILYHPRGVMAYGRGNP